MEIKKNWYKQRDGSYGGVVIDDMKGLTFTRVEADWREIRFFTEDGKFAMLHHDDCCEDVYVESIVGDLFDLVGSPILLAEESTSNENPLEEREESFTWTFYKFATIKGYVDIRWYGSSNGYYSESVDIEFIPATATYE